MIMLYIIKEAIKSLQLPSAAAALWKASPAPHWGSTVQLTLLRGNPALGMWEQEFSPPRIHPLPSAGSWRAGLGGMKAGELVQPLNKCHTQEKGPTPHWG